VISEWNCIKPYLPAGAPANGKSEKDGNLTKFEITTAGLTPSNDDLTSPGAFAILYGELFSIDTFSRGVPHEKPNIPL
jgi:hypothetical protein